MAQRLFPLDAGNPSAPSALARSHGFWRPRAAGSVQVAARHTAAPRIFGPAGRRALGNPLQPIRGGESGGAGVCAVPALRYAESGERAMASRSAEGPAGG